MLTVEDAELKDAAQYFVSVSIGTQTFSSNTSEVTATPKWGAGAHWLWRPRLMHVRAECRSIKGATLTGPWCVCVSKRRSVCVTHGPVSVAEPQAMQYPCTDAQGGTSCCNKKTPQWRGCPCTVSFAAYTCGGGNKSSWLGEGSHRRDRSFSVGIWEHGAPQLHSVEVPSTTSKQCLLLRDHPPQCQASRCTSSAGASSRCTGISTVVRHARCDVDLATYFDKELHQDHDSQAPGRRILQQPVAPGRHACILKVAAVPTGYVGISSSLTAPDAQSCARPACCPDRQLLCWLLVARGLLQLC